MQSKCNIPTNGRSPQNEIASWIRFGAELRKYDALVVVERPKAQIGAYVYAIGVSEKHLEVENLRIGGNGNKNGITLWLRKDCDARAET